jgi:hypothetical protein
MAVDTDDSTIPKLAACPPRNAQNRFRLRVVDAVTMRLPHIRHAHSLTFSSPSAAFSFSVSIESPRGTAFRTADRDEDAAADECGADEDECGADEDECGADEDERGTRDDGGADARDRSGRGGNAMRKLSTRSTASPKVRCSVPTPPQEMNALAPTEPADPPGNPVSSPLPPLARMQIASDGDG